MNGTPIFVVVNTYIYLFVLRFELQGSERLVEVICNRIDGCRVVSGTCPTCVIDKVWE